MVLYHHPGQPVCAEEKVLVLPIEHVHIHTAQAAGGEQSAHQLRAP